MLALVSIVPALAPGQHSSSSRGAALGAYTGVAAGLGALDWNPAGLTGIRDWEIAASNFLPVNQGGAGFTFHNLAAGKRLLPDHSMAVRFSPGLSLEFVVPALFTVEDSNSSITTEFDREISYTEQLALGYAFRAAGQFSVGFSGHFLEERVRDTEYSIDTNNVITSSPVEYEGRSWSIDWGAVWEASPSLRVGAVAKNLFRITESSLPGDAEAPALSPPKTVRVGGAYSGVRDLMLAADADLEKQVRAGAEWTPAEYLRVGAGLYFNGDDRFRAEAVSAGASTSFGNVEMGAAILLFTSRENRGGSADLSKFQSGISSIEYNAFTGDRASFDIAVRLGRTRPPMAKIEYVEMASDIHPSSSAVYAFRPLGKARVRNLSDAPIEATVRFSVGPYTDAPTESRPQLIPPGEAAEIPFFAVLNAAVRGVSSMTVGEGEVSVSAVRAEGTEDSYPARVLIRGRNDWNGDVTLLKYFLTPDDPEILALTRAALRDSSTGEATPRGSDFERARTLFNALSGSLLYVSDPEGSEDRVQYPSETLSLRGGDCDDLTVLFCSMLSSVGIPTAFVDVVPPGRPDSAHIYMMFDTGVAEADAGIVAENPKRWIVRRNARGKATVWIPLEPTLTRAGFDAAWEEAANAYYRDAEVGMGTAHGWVRIVDHAADF